MELAAGTRLGPYEILSRIGAGGMGQVWKARDTRLNRIVAVKIAAAEFSDRFEREARAVAGLNHPNICTLYDIGPDYLVMEYVEGSEIKGPLQLDQALRLAIQMASALEAAHRGGVTHRDLKPANLLVTKSGVKMLDFGLARMAPTKEVAASDETLAGGLTQTGTIVGTLQYMAPEQLQSKTADARADIFSFGCILYEMLTGKRAFDGANSASVIAAILEREPPPMAESVPSALNWTLRRCLAKDPDERWQTARDLRAALERVSEHAAEVQRAGNKSGLPTQAWMAAVAILVVSTAALAWLHFGMTPAQPMATRLSINPPTGARFSGTAPPAVSPDGASVVFEATAAGGKSQLWLRPLNSVNALPLPGTESGNAPFWSPDNKQIGFFAAGSLKKLDIPAGTVTTLANSAVAGGTWNQAGVIVFSSTYAGALQQILASGGTARAATAVPANPQPQRSPWFLPDGKHFLYLYGSGQGRFAIHIGSLDSAERDRVLPDAADSSIVDYADGNILFLRGAALVARRFDAKNMAFTGDPVPIAEQAPDFGASANGVLVFQSGGGPTRMAWTDRAGKRLGMLENTGNVRQFELSPNRRMAAITIREPSTGNVDIWLYEIARGLRTRITFDPGTDAFPIWSPDGRTVVFRSNRTGQFDLYRTSVDVAGANSSGRDELVYADGVAKVPVSISPDGRYLAYWIQDSKTGNGIGFLPDPFSMNGSAKSDAKPDVRLSPEFNQDHPQFSPDGRWVAWQSDETGRYEIYVAAFPGLSGKRQVSTGGGTNARWRRDGKELFYAGLDNRLMAAQVFPKNNVLVTGKVDSLFALESPSYDASADGQQFLVFVSPESEAIRPLTVVQNWTVGLKK